MSLQADSSAPRAAVATPQFHVIYEWLLDEAELLDQARYSEWMRLLDEDVVYRAPVRINVAHDLTESFREDISVFDEDYHSLSKRVERLYTEHAWAEDPPSRTRRFVTNIRAFSGEAEGLYAVRSYLLLLRSRGDRFPADMLSAVRTDVLRETPAGLRLLERLIWLDDPVVRTINLAVFL